MQASSMKTSLPNWAAVSVEPGEVFIELSPVRGQPSSSSVHNGCPVTRSSRSATARARPAACMTAHTSVASGTGWVTRTECTTGLPPRLLPGGHPPGTAARRRTRSYTSGEVQLVSWVTGRTPASTSMSACTKRPAHRRTGGGAVSGSGASLPGWSLPSRSAVGVSGRAGTPEGRAKDRASVPWTGPDVGDPVRRSRSDERPTSSS